jgi:CheY-like chemotaxis protein
LNASRRASGLTNQLLAFSRKQIISPRPLDLALYLTALADMVRRAVTERTEVAFATPEDTWAVYMDPTQVDQIVLNLATNARDAMPDGGRLTISTENVVLDAAFCAAHPGAAPGEHVLLRVRDEGMGMDEETARNAFEPFYTTKPEGTGTGIGLASVHGIVVQNGGFVLLESALGRGTRVDVYLPRHAGELPLPVEPGPPLNPGRASETVLLVEDNVQVRSVTRRTLEQLGYRVVEARSAAHALALCESHPDVLDLLLSDMVMPGMDGAELAVAARRIRPGIGILLVSGYSDQLETAHLPEGAIFLAKPFDSRTLAAALRAILDVHPGFVPRSN